MWDNKNKPYIREFLSLFFLMYTVSLSTFVSFDYIVDAKMTKQGSSLVNGIT